MGWTKTLRLRRRRKQPLGRAERRPRVAVFLGARLFMLRATKTSIPRTISPETIVLDNCFSYHDDHVFLFPYTVAERLSARRSRIYGGDVWRTATAQYHRIRILSVFTRV